MKFVHLYKYLITTVFIISFWLSLLVKGEVAPQISEEEQIQYVNATVLKLLSDIPDPDVGYLNKNAKIQTAQIEVTSGDLRGKKYVIENRMIGNKAYDIPLKKGSRIVVSIEDDLKNNQQASINVADLNRFPATVLLLSSFLLLILLVGGKMGVKTIMSLITILCLVFYLFIPQVHSGISPLFSAVITSILATAITIMTICGINIKAFSSIIGTIGGVLSASGFAHLMILLAPLSGIYDESSIYLSISYPKIDLQELLIAGMLIAALGAAMDVAISISSAMQEIYEANPSRSLTELLISGMKVGRDIMGTMTDTLILAYAGASLPLLVMLYNLPASKVFNLNSVTTEITAAISGSIGLILTVPITAIAFIGILKIQAKKRLT